MNFDKRFLLLVTSIVSTLGWIVGVSMFDKASAAWGGFNVIVVGLVMAFIIGGVMLMITFAVLSHYQPVPDKWAIIIIAGALSCIIGGIVMTELPRSDDIVVAEDIAFENRQEERYYHSRAGGGVYHWFYSSSTYVSSGSSGGSSSSSGFSCTGDCGEALGTLLLFLVFIILFIGSLFVPHFWVAAGIVWIVLLWLFTLRELTMVSDDFGYKYKNY